MVSIIAKSGFAGALDTGAMEDLLDNTVPRHAELIEAFGESMDTGLFAPSSLSATAFVFDATLDGFSLQLSFNGTGLGPFGSLAQFEAAFDAGVATGAITNISVTGSKSPQFPGDTAIPDVKFLNVNFAANGYTISSGMQKIIVKGALPTSMSDFFDLGQSLDQLANFDTLSNAQKNALISDLSTLDFNSLRIMSEGTEVMAFTAGANAVSFSQLGYKFILEGSFPANVGAALPMLMRVDDFFNGGAALDFSDIAGFEVTGIKIKGPDGKVLARTVGDFGTSETITLDSIKIDGKTANNVQIGENGSNADQGGFFDDQLIGTNARDHLFGLAGHDFLDGGNGNDFLFGGTGNDNLDGGEGNDFLNPGDNHSYDTVIGSAGNDTIDFGDNIGGFQQIYYGALNAPVAITANINGKTNTGTVLKGALGADTILDVKQAMNSVKVDPAVGGFQIDGTTLNDSFTLTNTNGGWMAVRGGAGVDTYVLGLTANSITRLQLNDGFQGVKVNVGLNKIGNDGHGNAESLVRTDTAGYLELRGSDFNDRLVGSANKERFITERGNDFVDGKGGIDLIRYDRSGVDAVNVDLGAGTASGTWRGVAFTDTLKNIENLRGSRADDDILKGSGARNKIEGRGGDDLIDGRGKNDVLMGEDGDDTILGGGGKDRLVGGADDDSLTGGAKRDTFVYNGNLDEGEDRITDFENGIDRIEIAGESFADLKIQKAGGGSNARVVLDSGTEILLVGVSKGDLDASDFIFV